MSLIENEGGRYSFEYYVKGERWRDISNADLGLLIRRSEHRPVVEVETPWFVVIPKELL